VVRVFDIPRQEGFFEAERLGEVVEGLLRASGVLLDLFDMLVVRTTRGFAAVWTTTADEMHTSSASSAGFVTSWMKPCRSYLWSSVLRKAASQAWSGYFLEQIGVGGEAQSVWMPLSMVSRTQLDIPSVFHSGKATCNAAYTGTSWLRLGFGRRWRCARVRRPR